MAMAASTSIITGPTYTNQSTLHGRKHIDCLFRPSPLSKSLSIRHTFIRCESPDHVHPPSIRQKPTSYSSSSPSSLFSSSNSCLETISASESEERLEAPETICGDGNNNSNNGDGDNNNNNSNNNNGDGHGFSGDGGGEGDDGEEDEYADKEFGPIVGSEEVLRQTEARGIRLPPDMAEAAKTVGIRSLVLSNFIELQGASWPLGAAVRGSTVIRNRMLADRNFFFKLLTEIAIDSGCATVAEVQKRGDDFWNEFELYMADLVVGVVVDVALVMMLAPFIQFRKPPLATGPIAKLSRAIQNLPSSVFEAATPGRRFTVQQRIASYFYKGIQYGGVGFSCGIVGQGIANSIMSLKRKMKKSDEDVPVPPLVKSAALWGVFLAVSSNTRYQIVNGLESVVEGSVIAKRLPIVAMAFTIGIRFANNTYGGMQFVDWARWSGVQ